MEPEQLSFQQDEVPSVWNLAEMDYSNQAIPVDPVTMGRVDLGPGQNLAVLENRASQSSQQIYIAQGHEKLEREVPEGPSSLPHLPTHHQHQMVPEAQMNVNMNMSMAQMETDQGNSNNDIDHNKNGPANNAGRKTKEISKKICDMSEREKKKERNRQAAAKCREKKAKKISDLEIEVRELKGDLDVAQQRENFYTETCQAMIDLVKQEFRNDDSFFIKVDNLLKMKQMQTDQDTVDYQQDNNCQWDLWYRKIKKSRTLICKNRPSEILFQLIFISS